MQRASTGTALGGVLRCAGWRLGVAWEPRRLACVLVPLRFAPLFTSCLPVLASALVSEVEQPQEVTAAVGASVSEAEPDEEEPTFWDAVEEQREECPRRH